MPLPAGFRDPLTSTWDMPAIGGMKRRMVTSASGIGWPEAFLIKALTRLRPTFAGVGSVVTLAVMAGPDEAWASAGTGRPIASRAPLRRLSESRMKLAAV